MTLRVVLVCPYSLDVPGGVGSHVLGLARWLATQGHRPTVVAPGRRAVDAGPGVRVELLGGTTALPFNGSVAHLALRPSQSRRAVELMAGADVIHVHEPLTPGAGHATARAAARLVVTHHANYRLPAPLNAVLRIRSRRLGPRLALAVSPEAARTALAVTGARAAVVPNAVHLPDGVELPPRDRPRVAFLGRCDERRKGFAVFAELARLARAGGLDAEFVAAGPGRARATAVRHLGPLDEPARARFLAGTDVLVAPNTSGESFGMVLVEALAAGCDVVASDLPAFVGVLGQAGVGATFRAGSAPRALEVLRTRLAAPPGRDEARAAAVRWGWETVGPEVVAAYEAVVAMA